MNDVTTRLGLVREQIVPVAIVAGVPVLVWLAMTLGRLGTFAAVGLIAVVAGTYVGLRHPLWLFWGLAFTLAALPFGYFPGVHVPMYLAFAVGSLLAALIHPSARTGLSRAEKAMVALVVVSALSLLFGGVNLPGMVTFGKWAIASLMMIALLRLSPANMATFGRVYVYAAAANGLFGVYVVLADPAQKSYNLLSIFGYGAGGAPGALRYVFADDQGSAALRLGGTWVEPNSAGLSMLFAVGIGVVVLQGWRRLAVTAVFLIAIPLTLSRAALATLIIAFVVVLLFHTMRSRDRILGMVALLLIPAAALAVPTVRSRIFSTLSSTDPGANDRARSLREFPSTMSGHWLFGLGWGRPEFTDGALAFQLNYVSNAPLITIYRGGIFTGLAFIVLMVIGCIMGYRGLRSPLMGNALLGGIFISSVFLAIQLDHTVASSPQPTLLFSAVLAFLVTMSRRGGAAPGQEPLLPPEAKRIPPTSREFLPAEGIPPLAEDAAAPSARY
jgi:hypothetical protein